MIDLGVCTGEPVEVFCVCDQFSRSMLCSQQGLQYPGDRVLAVDSIERSVDNDWRKGTGLSSAADIYGIFCVQSVGNS